MSEWELFFVMLFPRSVFLYLLVGCILVFNFLIGYFVITSFVQKHCHIIFGNIQCLNSAAVTIFGNVQCLSFKTNMTIYGHVQNITFPVMCSSGTCDQNITFSVIPLSRFLPHIRHAVFTSTSAVVLVLTSLGFVMSSLVMLFKSFISLFNLLLSSFGVLKHGFWSSQFSNFLFLSVT